MAPFQRFRDLFRRVMRRRPTKPPSAPPADPYAGILAPVRRGPKGRSGAAVADAEQSV